MKVTARFLIPSDEVRHRKEDQIQIRDGATIRDLLKEIRIVHGGGFVGGITDLKTGEVRRNIAVLVNGTEIRNLNGLDTQLKDADAVVFMAVVGGGETPR